MRFAGVDQAIGNLMKWSDKDDWAPYRDEVFASHFDEIEDQFGVTARELSDTLGEAFGMLYGVILEDFFSARFGDDGELNVIDDYLKRRGWREKVPAKRYLEAMRDSAISLYEIVDLEPGKTMTVRDMIAGGEPVTVAEKQGSSNAAKWDRIATRLVTVNNKLWFTGGMLLLSHGASDQFMAMLDDMTKSFRNKLRREAKKQGESADISPDAVKAMIMEEVGPRLLTQAWLADALQRTLAPMPEMRNSDGDAILFSEVRFPIKGDAAELAAIIDAMDDVDRDMPDAPTWTWHGQGSPSQRMAATDSSGLTLQTRDDGGRTSLGMIKIQDRALLLSTNSRERAERGRDLLASHLGALVGPALISHEDVERALENNAGAPAPQEDEIPPEIAQQLIHQYLDDHYRQTLDDPIPSLAGKSPRQAVKTKKGRAQVVEWLKHLENNEHRRAKSQGQEPYDTAWMWRELKIEDER